jgi:hypothetical protein
MSYKHSNRFCKQEINNRKPQKLLYILVALEKAFTNLESRTMYGKNCPARSKKTALRGYFLTQHLISSYLHVSLQKGLYKMSAVVWNLYCVTYQSLSDSGQNICRISKACMLFSKLSVFLNDFALFPKLRRY